MPQLIKHGVVVEDRWTLVRQAGSLAGLVGGEPVIVPLALWLQARAALIARSEAGVWLGPDDDPARIAPDARFLPVIAIDFPVFTDGRGYSIARLLRERYAYQGELRAIGDVQRDQLHYLAHCGFDAFALPANDVQAALAGFGDLSDGYQATNLRTPWFRRRADASPPGDVWFPCA
ncbi:MAG: DUF934 domain-containing protein [Betaproteobacteria bacterium]|nr:DUF934 domain-containing protein [Betaproteobacteria bacterium]MBA3776005.1 DUF934 domain-containing protein [Betaproteobacteria bacterium]